MGNRALWSALVVVCAATLANGEKQPDRAKLVELGRRLFMDPTVSASGRFSCASCHLPDHGFSDPRVRSVEHNGESRRHSQPVTDLLDGTGMHRDGEFDTVRELIEARLFPAAKFSIHKLRERHYERARRDGRRPDEKSFQTALTELPSPFVKGNLQKLEKSLPFTPLENRLREDGRYRLAFLDVFGTDKPPVDRIADALEAYVLSLRTEDNALDRFLAGETAALNAEQQRGYKLFAGKANCAQCHSLEPVGGRVLLTDRAYHNTGVAFPNLVVVDGRRGTGDGGRGSMTHVADDLGRFKTPSLRDVAKRAPFMHDGSIATLEKVVEFYDRGGRRNPYLDTKLAPLGLTSADKAALVAFLRALNSPRRAGLGPVPPKQATRLTIVDARGKPLPNLAVRIEPFGDRLGRSADGALSLRTDRKGRVDFDFPAWTHVVVEANGYEIACGRPIPDSVRELEIRAVPLVDHVVELVDVPAVPRVIKALDPESGAVVATLNRIRKVGGQRALYSVTTQRKDELAVVRLSIDARARGVVELDLSGGESDPIRVPSSGEDRSSGYN